MPLYEYQCLPHRHRFELRQSINDDPVETCAECGGAVRRLIHPVGIVFKGSGFYVTDSRKTTSDDKPSKSEPAASTDAPSTAKPDSSKADAKSGSTSA